MWRALDSRDFRRSADPALFSGNYEEPWYVCERYEVRGEEIVAAYPVKVETPLAEWRGWRDYEPLSEEPDLFLKFAALHKASDFVPAALVFAHKYGLPGCYEPADARRGFGFEDLAVSLNRENLLVWRKAAEHAWFVLTMYEAALRADAEAAETLCRDFERSFGPFEAYRRQFENATAPFWLEGAVTVPMGTVAEMTNDACGQALAWSSSSDYLKPSNVRTFWYFNTLLGAMYLQMRWLLVSGKDLTRCEFCGRAISLSEPQPGGRKRRRDKRFCDDACRQAHHRSKKKS